jgi:hypothetical protein
VTQQPVLQSEEQRQRVLEAAARDAALLGAGHQVEHAGPRDGDRRRGRVREGDRGAPGVAMRRSAAVVSSVLPLAEIPIATVPAPPGRRRHRARVLGDRMDTGRAEPGGDHRGRVPRRPHPQQDDPAGPGGTAPQTGRRIQTVGQRTEPLGLVFQVARGTARRPSRPGSVRSALGPAALRGIPYAHMSDRLTILFMPESAYGPTNNCIGIGKVLERRGHRVIFAAEASWKGRLEPLGFEEDLVDLAPPPKMAPSRTRGSSGPTS